MLYIKLKWTVYARMNTHSVLISIFIFRPHFLADLDLPKEEVTFCILFIDISFDFVCAQWFIDIILCRHARKLLSSCQLRQLGKFAAILDFPLVSWLNKERWNKLATTL